MACKDKEKFGSAEASTKSAMRTKGAIDKFLNIIDTNQFRKLNNSWSKVAKDRYGLDGKLFFEENDKAIPNTDMFHQVDAAKGIFYEANQQYRTSTEGVKPFVLESKKDLNELSTGTTEVFGIVQDELVDENNDEINDFTNEIKSILFNGEVKNIPAKDVLINILNSGLYENNSYMSELISALLISTKANVKTIAPNQLQAENTYMQYNTLTNTIEIEPNNLGRISSVEAGVSKFIHEVFHDRTLRVLRQPKNESEQNLITELSDYFNQVKDLIPEGYEYEMSSLEEFTAAMFSNKEFEIQVRTILNSDTGFWNKLINFFKGLFNLNSSYDNLMNNILKLIDTTDEVYNSNEVLESRYNIGKKVVNQSSLDKVSDKINNVLKVLQLQSNRLAEDSKFKKTIRTILNDIKKSEKELGDNIDEHRKKSIELFITFMNSQLFSIDKRLEKADKFNSNIFNSSKAYLDAFISIQSDVENALIELKTANTLTSEEFDTLNKSLNTVQGNALRIKADLIRVAKNNIKLNSGKFSKGYKEVELRYQEDIKRQGRELGYTKRELDDYVNKQMSENRDIIISQTNSEFNSLLDAPIVDIDALSAVMNTEKDLNHPIINIFSSILDSVKDIYDNIIQTKLIEIQDKTNTFLEGKRTKSSDEVYKNMVEFSEDGTAFLKGEYKIEYYNKVKKLRGIRDAMQTEHGVNSKEYKDTLADYKLFVKENTTEIGDGIIVPLAKWRNDLTKLSQQERDYLKYIQYLAKRSNVEYGVAAKSLKKNVLYADYYELPKIRKAQISTLKSGNFLQTAKEFYNETFTQQSDQEDLGELTNASDVYKVYTDLSGKEVRYIPIHYRIKISQKEQSIDLPTIYSMEFQNAVKFNTKNKVANDLLMFKDVIQEGKFIKKKGFGNRIISSVYNKNNDPVEYSKEDAYLIKMLDTMLNNRLYDKSIEYAGQIFGQDINKLESFIRGTVSKASMALNMIGAPANVITGKSQSMLEVIRDPNLHRDNVVKAEKAYYQNIGGFMDDMGRNVYKSLGNQLLISYGGLVSHNMIVNDYEHNKALAMTGTKPLYFFQESGEHHVQAVHTMTILDAAKILNAKGEYLDKDGKVTTRDNAVSLLDITTLENGKLGTTIKTPFYTTLDRMNEFSKGGKNTVRSYIQSSLIKSQGNYSNEYTNELQRKFYGKALIHFKKHIISPTLSRWRGISTNLGSDDNVNIKFNYDLQRPDEGNYVTTIRWIKNSVLPKIKKLQLDLLMKDFNSRSDWEKANIKRTFTEIAIIQVFAGLSLMFAASAGDGDDDLWYAAAIFRRLESEASQYYDITEAWRVFKNPISSLNFLESTSSLLGSLINLVDPLEDERLDRLLKSTTNMAKFIPGSKLFKDSEDAYNYLNKNQ